MHDLKQRDFQTNERFWIGNFVRDKQRKAESVLTRARTKAKAVFKFIRGAGKTPASTEEREEIEMQDMHTK